MKSLQGINKIICQKGSSTVERQQTLEPQVNAVRLFLTCEGGGASTTYTSQTWPGCDFEVLKEPGPQGRLHKALSS